MFRARLARGATSGFPAGDHRHRGIKDVGIRAASTGVALNCALDVVAPRVGIAAQLSRNRHHHSRSAKSALESIVGDKRGLHGMKILSSAEAFDGNDVVAAGISRQHHAGGYRPAVEMHRAGATSAAVAYHFGTGELQMIAEDFEQRNSRLNDCISNLAIDAQFDRNGFGANAFADALFGGVNALGSADLDQSGRCGNRAGAFDERTAAYCSRSS